MAKSWGKLVDRAIPPPIVVDLDGSLTPTDTLVESLIKWFRKSPANILRFPFWLMKGRARLKEAVAAEAAVAADGLPYHQNLLAFLRQEKTAGRQIILATAAHVSIAQSVCGHLEIFDGMLATDAGQNLKGEAKLNAIRRRLGDNFVYAGDSRADIPIWKAARAAILVGVAPRTAAQVRAQVPVEREFARERIGPMDWMRALRVHQWLKNLLLFVPLLTAFSFLDPVKLTTVSVAFLSFSLSASATYIVNDLWDLESDRDHPRKRLRPFASARIPILHGLLAAALALGAGIVLALLVSPAFLAMLFVYLAITSAYSWTLKEYVLIDVLTLSLLYTLRILAGSVAAGISTSSWLLAFSVFMFLSLALVKRCAELLSLEQNGLSSTRGRDYRVSDLAVLWPLGVGAAVSAVVVFGLFVSAPDTQSHYASPQLLWLAAIGLIYWLARLWIKTSRGEMHDDPVIYAVKNHGSRITVLGIVLVMLAAHFFKLPVTP